MKYVHHKDGNPADNKPDNLSIRETDPEELAGDVLSGRRRIEDVLALLRGDRQANRRRKEGEQDARKGND